MLILRCKRNNHYTKARSLPPIEIFIAESRPGNFFLNLLVHVKRQQNDNSVTNFNMMSSLLCRNLLFSYLRGCNDSIIVPLGFVFHATEEVQQRNFHQLHTKARINCEMCHVKVEEIQLTTTHSATYRIKIFIKLHFVKQ